jgi:uncharacterized protein YdeI (YjbR/CyaY-like superfamily)
MTNRNPSVDGYIRKSRQWQEELKELRRILLECELTEEVKWRTPCYTFQNHNVAFIGRFKDNCVLSFIKGALLKDPEGILIQQTPNSQSARIIRFTNVGQVLEKESVLKAYLKEAIEAERAGLKVKFRKVSESDWPEEFRIRLEADPALKKAFEALTPGRQRAYLLHFSGAKQSKTRSARVEKCAPRILSGKGLDDE